MATVLVGQGNGWVEEDKKEKSVAMTSLDV